MTGGGAAAWRSRRRGTSKPRTESPAIAFSQIAGGGEAAAKEKRGRVWH